MENPIPSYPKIQADKVGAMLRTPKLVVVQEKIDGSQFSFGFKDGQLYCQSRKNLLDLENPQKQFRGAVQTAKLIAATLLSNGWTRDGWIYRGESVQTPRHNVLAYGEVPKGNLVLYDIEASALQVPNIDYGRYQCSGRIDAELALLGYPCAQVREFYVGPGNELTVEMLKGFLEEESVLGGCKVEGVVTKSYTEIDVRRQCTLMAKMVCKEFKEKMQCSPKRAPALANEVIAEIASRFATPARFQKAVSHCGEEGLLHGAAEDIPILMKEFFSDMDDECGDDIMDILRRTFYKKIVKAAAKGLPQWYRDVLTNASCEGEPGPPLD